MERPLPARLTGTGCSSSALPRTAFVQMPLLRDAENLPNMPSPTTSISGPRTDLFFLLLYSSFLDPPFGV
jgi:hypothetical protein